MHEVMKSCSLRDAPFWIQYSPSACSLSTIAHFQFPSCTEMAPCMHTLVVIYAGVHALLLFQAWPSVAQCFSFEILGCQAWPSAAYCGSRRPSWSGIFSGLSDVSGIFFQQPAVMNIYLYVIDMPLFLLGHEPFAPLRLFIDLVWMEVHSAILSMPLQVSSRSAITCTTNFGVHPEGAFCLCVLLYLWCAF